MYSLYRAWLSMGPCASGMPSTSMQSLPPPMPGNMPLNLSTPPQLTGAPDVSLQVGPSLTNFSAHKTVLSTHSGFFKAALATVTGSGPILVPNINVDEFSSLLTFMYTGYLDLNLTNIYNILLATHILHMPRALEICRNFLMQSHPLETRINSANIIKPIPSRKTMLPHQEVYQPIFSSLEKSEKTPFKKIQSTEVSNKPVAEPHASTSKEVPKEDATKDVVEKKDKQRSKARKEQQHQTHDKVIIDVACCDGPVRFHRVINKNYGMVQDEATYTHDNKIDRNDVMNKVMNENINRDKQLTDENQRNQAQTGEVFTCLYCNHTFKSQYCYQKHARRHLNPVSVDTKKVIAENKREVKLLDMNVQYYPCKTCGSKFPSYYFVHKHRKLCHADEMADNTNKNNEIIQVKDGEAGATEELPQEENSSSRTSIIDVEETDNNE